MITKDFILMINVDFSPDPSRTGNLLMSSSTFFKPSLFSSFYVIESNQLDSSLLEPSLSNAQFGSFSRLIIHSLSYTSFIASLFRAFCSVFFACRCYVPFFTYNYDIPDSFHFLLAFYLFCFRYSVSVRYLAFLLLRLASLSIFHLFRRLAADPFHSPASRSLIFASIPFVALTCSLCNLHLMNFPLTQSSRIEIRTGLVTVKRQVGHTLRQAKKSWIDYYIF